MVSMNFDATKYEPNRPLELLPPGKYEVQIVQSDERATKDAEGKYIWLEMEIISGQSKGRKLWDRLNMVNKNQQAVDIANRTFSAICHAVGILHCNNTDQLHFRPMIATVKVKPASGQYDASNEVRGYEPVDGAAQPQSQEKKSTTPPWQKSR